MRNREVSGAEELLPGLGAPKRWREEDEEGEYKPKRMRISQPTRWAKDPNVDTPTPEDITDEMMEGV